MADTTPFALTWWGHATTTVEVGGVRVLTDPVLTDRVAHLGRLAPSPTPEAARADVVLLSHLHRDHLHPRSLRRVSRDAVVVVPRGGERLLARTPQRDVRPVAPGEVLEVAGLRIGVLPAKHSGRRSRFSGAAGRAQGFHVTGGDHSFWYAGDTGAPVPSVGSVSGPPVDLALVPIGGWGPTLGEMHLDPEQAAAAVEQVGARRAVPVHHGTLWPVGLRWVMPRNHRRLFAEPAGRFVHAMADSATETVVPPHGERVVLVA